MCICILRPIVVCEFEGDVVVTSHAIHGTDPPGSYSSQRTGCAVVLRSRVV